MEIRFDPIKNKSGEIIEALMASPDMPDDEALLFKIRLCIEEVVENIVNYAYTHGDGWIVGKTERIGDSIVISLRDAGIPFDPLAKADPDITLPAEARDIGGLGIFLCKKMMDSVRYEYTDGCNVFTMEKKINNDK